MLNINLSTEDHDLVVAIADRAASILGLAKFDVIIDLAVCHCNGCPLRLADLLASDGVNFAHDVFGIHSRLDHVTGELRDCFLPRYAQPEVLK